MKLVREILAGSVTYPKAAEAYLGYWNDSAFVPMFYIGQWRQNAHNSRESFTNWVAALPLEVNVDLSQPIEITGEDAQNVVGARYRQQMTRERPQAIQVLENARNLAGKWLPSDAASALIKTACADYDTRKPEKEVISDPWKYRHVYRALCSLLESKF